MQEPIIGIDLGTTYSCVAYIDEFGRPVVLKNLDNESTTPSVVAFDPHEDQALVGQIAKDQKEVLDKDFIVDFIKREMGDPNWRKEIKGNIYSPQEISAIILKKLVQDASAVLGQEIKRVVVTHPAYYDIPQKSAVAEAGQIAGLSGYIAMDAGNDGYIPVNLIPEPTAAAFYYGVKNMDKDQTVLVYDLGGGTFDVTVLKISNEEIETICVKGDHTLGGKNWDEEIIRFCLHSAGIDEEEFVQDSIAYGALQLRAEKNKKFLSIRQSTPINFSYQSSNYRVDLSLEEFNSLTSHLLEQTINLCQEVQQLAAEKGCPKIDRVLLVGGSTRMKQIQDRLKEIYPDIPIEFHEPDEAVAKGAAIYANLLLMKSVIPIKFFDHFGHEYDGTNPEDRDKVENDPELKRELLDTLGDGAMNVLPALDRKLTNVTGKAFGIKCLTREGNRFKSIIPAQSKLPAENTEPFGTAEDFMENAEILVMETDLTDTLVNLDYCSKVSESSLSLPPGLPKNTEIKVTFRINEQGMLYYRALHEPSGNMVEGEITVAGSLTKQEMEESTKRTGGLVIQ